MSNLDEKPVKIIQRKAIKGEHKLETRIFARNIHETYCVQKNCKFHGKLAAQGVCHTKKTFNGSSDWSYVDGVMRQGEQHLAFIKKHAKNKEDYIKQLEGEVVCGFSNSIFTLDELIRLRRKVALLETKNK
jgi:hypothetical protein